jgi:hypothetical protein
MIKKMRRISDTESDMDEIELDDIIEEETTSDGNCQLNAERVMAINNNSTQFDISKLT